VTGFELKGILRLFKEINHLAMQKSEKCGRISATPQPDATGISEAGGTRQAAGNGQKQGRQGGRLAREDRSGPAQLTCHTKGVVPVRDRQTTEGVVKFFSRQKPSGYHCE